MDTPKEDDDYGSKRLKLELNIRQLQAKQREIASKIKTLQTEKDELEHAYKLSKIRNRTSTREWIENKFDWSDRVKKILNEKFHFDNFRLKQLAAINATLSKKDVLLLMPTGGGKSLVYQLPALINKRLTLVVSPLISLIEDQLMALRKLGIEAGTLNGNSVREESKKIYNDMVHENCKLRLLYVTPEWLTKSKVFMSYLQKCFNKGNLDRVVIDEVHCCCTWGHDFRPDYNSLGCFKTLFPEVPILGLTATATIKMLSDIQDSLNLEDALILTTPFNRPNLFYMVVNKPYESTDSMDTIAKWMQTKYKGQSGIIYVSTRKETEQLNEGLKERGLRVKRYHAGMQPHEKKMVYERWMSNIYQAVIATIAFGMGIDKPDVRFVIHYTVPKSIEGFYQESGRAGRDGKNADCILLFSLSDYLMNASKVLSKVEEINSKNILAYCLEQTKCRRALMADHFEDSWRETDCMSMCDHCKNPTRILHFDIVSAARDLLCLIEAGIKKETKLTLHKLMSSWFQSGAKNLRLPSVKKPKCSKQQAEHIIGFLICNGTLFVEKGFTLYTTLAYIQRDPKYIPAESIIMPYRSDINYPKVEQPVVRETADVVDVDIIKEPPKKIIRIEIDSD